jgi:predicted transcriptional regulator
MPLVTHKNGLKCIEFRFTTSHAEDLGRDYKNVYTDVRRLENIGLIGRAKNDRINVPWDIVEARLLLAA